MSSNSKPSTDSPVVSTNSDLSSPEEDKCILTPLSLEFDPLNWKLEEHNKSINNSSGELSGAAVTDLTETMQTMTDCMQSNDLLTLDDDYTDSIENSARTECSLAIGEQFEPSPKPDVHESGDDMQNLINFDMQKSSSDCALRSTNECQITNTCDTSTANLIAAKLVSECVADALHVHAVTRNDLPDHRSQTPSQTSSLSDSDSHESVQSVSSASSGSGPVKRKKKNTKKKSSNASKSSVPHEQQISTDIKTNSIEANNKSIDNIAVNHDEDQLNGQKAQLLEVNGHEDEANNSQKNVDNELPAINGHCSDAVDVDDSIEQRFSKQSDFDNDSLNESAISSEPEYSISVAKLTSEYVNHVQHEEKMLKSFPKEIANTGIDFKSLKDSYISSSEHYVNANNVINKEMFATGVNVNSIKSAFNGAAEPSDAVKAKSRRKSFTDNKDDSSLCKICNKHVYQMEKIKAVKSIFHKSCFRCKECSKVLNVDTYSSHEGEIYCTPHFRQLFQPKAKFDNEDLSPVKCDPLAYDIRDEKARQRKYELIIRENTPQELPPDVVRCNTKVVDEFDNLHLDLSNIRNRFELGANGELNSNQNSIDKPFSSSEGVHKIMQKYQSKITGERNSSASSSDDEGIETGNAKESVDREKTSHDIFGGIASTLKSQWEHGKIASAKEGPEDDTKEELAKLRHNIGLGRSESLRQVYERAIKESNLENVRSESPVVLDSTVKTNSIKEKFEKGISEEERLETLRKEREEELNAFAETDSAAKEARNKFKQIDANAKLNNVQHSASTNFSHTNGHSRPAVALNRNDVVKCNESAEKDDFSFDSAQLQERRKYFESIKDEQKEPKRSQSREANGDGNVRYCDATEDIPKIDTTKRMLDKFKELENKKENDNNIGPKPVKRITPPRESTINNDHQHESSPVRDPNIIRSSLKSDDVCIEPEKARSLKAKFENWTDVDRDDKRNGDVEDEYVPHIDTTKNLRAKFEAIMDESNKLVEKPKPKVNRFVHEVGSIAISDLCSVCGTRMYPMEKLEFSGMKLHKNCFRCAQCSSSLRLDNYTTTGGRMYCIPHFKQLFMAKGNYDEGFGLEQHKDKWADKHRPNTLNDDNNNDDNSKANLDENENAQLISIQQY